MQRYVVRRLLQAIPVLVVVSLIVFTSLNILPGDPITARQGTNLTAGYQEVVEQLVKVFEDHLNEPQAREGALALVALCVGGMVLARNVSDPELADDFRRAAHAKVLTTAGLNNGPSRPRRRDDGTRGRE